MIVTYSGSTIYGAIAVVSNLFLLFPYVDLGLGAAVTNSVANRSGDPRGVTVLIATTLRYLVVSGAAVSVVAILGTGLLFSWSDLLGVSISSAETTDRIVGLAIFIFGLAVPFGVGQRILIGMHRNHWAIFLNASASLIALLWVFAVITYGGVPAYLALAQPVGLLCVSVVMACIAFKSLKFPVKTIFQPTQFRMSGLLATGSWMLLVTAGVAVAIHSQRLILAHQGSGDALAQFALLMQFYLPVWSIFTAAGLAMWPQFTERRNQGERLFVPVMRSAMLLGLMGALCGLILIFAGPWAAGVVSNQQIQLRPELFIFAAGLLVIQAGQLPFGMAMTDRGGLRFQAFSAGAMAIAAVLLSWTLSEHIGAAGPPLALSIAVATCQLVPGVLYLKCFAGFGPTSLSQT